MADIITTQKPTRWDMTIYRGSVWPEWNFNVADDALAPITGFTVLMQVKLTPVSNTVKKELTGVSGFTISGSNVKFNTTVDIDEGSYVYDIQVKLSTGESFTQYAGKIIVTQDVSRDIGDI